MSDNKSDFTFADLFAGIGGFHIACEQNGGKLVLVSEKDKFARQSYLHNHNTEGVIIDKDITTLESLPDVDLVCGGFPCQAFSSAGKWGGFEDTRGTLFFDIARLVKQKVNEGKPPVLLFENVQGLLSHDKKRTMKTIVNTLKDMGYIVVYKVLNARQFGTIQNRKRVFIVAWHTSQFPNTDTESFVFPEGNECQKTLADFLEDENSIDEWYYLTDKQYNYIQNRRLTSSFAHSKDRLPSDTSFSTLTTRLRKGSNEDYVHVDLTRNSRCYTLREGLRLQGFPDTIELPVSKTQGYKQIGNSVHVGTVDAMVKAIKSQLLDTRGNE